MAAIAASNSAYSTKPVTCTRSATPAARAAPIRSTCQATSPTTSRWSRSSPGAASAAIAASVRLIGVWKPKEPATGASSGSPKRRRTATPAARSAGGGSGIPIGTCRTRSSGSSSRTTAAAQALCTRTPRCRRKQRALRRQREGRRLAVGPPALAARRRAADPAVVGRQPLLVRLVLAAAEGLVEEEVVEDEVVEGQHAGPLERQRQHTRVVVVVPHLVEGEPAVGAGLLGPHRAPARLDLRRHRLVGEAHQPHVGPSRQLGQQVERVVGDPRAHGRQRGDDVEAEVGGRHGPLGGGGGYAGSSSGAPGSAICPFRNASTKRSRSPSSTRSASPISAPVRWSLTSR